MWRGTAVTCCCCCWFGVFAGLGCVFWGVLGCEPGCCGLLPGLGLGVAPGWFGVLGVLGVLGALGVLLFGVEALSGVRPGVLESDVFGLGVAAGVPLGGCVVLGWAGCLGSWLGVADSGRLALGVVEAGFVFVLGVRVSAEPGVLVLGVLGFGARPGAVPGAGWFGCGVRLSGVPGVRPSVDGVGVTRGGVEGVGLGGEAGPVPVGLVVPGGVEGVLGGLCEVLGLVGLVLDGEPPGVVFVPVRAPAAASAAVEGGVGEVGIEELPSGRGPAVDGSAVVGVGAALDWVATLAARLSIDVLIPPPLFVEDGVPPAVGVGADCGEGEERPPGEEPPRLSPALGVLLLVSGAGDGVGDVLLGAGSSKSDSVGREGELEEEGFCPESGVPGVESGVPLGVSVLGSAPRSGAL